MSILNVNKINPVGGGSTVTIAGIASVTNNISVGNSVTASEFYGDGSNLTSLPSQVTITNNADNRVITGGSGTNLNGEASLTYNGLQLNISNDVPELFLTDTNSNNSYGRVRGNGGNLILSADVNNATGSSIINFEIDGSEKARIQDGRLLVGRTNNISVGGDASDHCFEQITNNGYTLTIHANQTNQRGLGMFYTSGKTPEAFMLCQVSTSNRLIIFGTGNVQNANNSYGQISDQSLKENIVDAKSQWNDIKNLKIRNFNFKSSTGYDTHTQIGLVAQEVETVCPKLVGTNEDGTKNVASSVLYMKAVKALQEAQARIETLEAKVAALEGS